jgi:hypothetical protein
MFIDPRGKAGSETRFGGSVNLRGPMLPSIAFRAYFGR